MILLDVRPPTIGGFEAAVFIRSRVASERTPIIFVTDIDRAEREMTLGYEMGVVDFVVAPIMPAALRAKVALCAELFAKSEALLEQTRQLREAAESSADALAFQLEMLDRMEELGRAKSDFVSKISHELRSPLTSVIGYVELLIDGVPDEPSNEQNRMLTIIERNSRRLLALIEDLLTMSRVEAGTFELEVGSVDLSELVQQVRDTAAPTIAQSALDLVIDLGPDLRLMGDRDQLERALLNLVSNSVKFTPAGGRIEITTRTVGDDIALSVLDTGSGIPFEEQEICSRASSGPTGRRNNRFRGPGSGSTS